MRYILTMPDMKTQEPGEEKITWEVGQWRENGTKWRDDAFIRWYTHPTVAVLMAPKYLVSSSNMIVDSIVLVGLDSTRLWEVETEEDVKTGKSKRVRLVREVPAPSVSIRQRIRFAILCAQKVYRDDSWKKWADDRLAEKNISHANASWERDFNMYKFALHSVVRYHSADFDIDAADYYSTHSAACACLAAANEYAIIWGSGDKRFSLATDAVLLVIYATACAAVSASKVRLLDMVHIAQEATGEEKKLSV